MTHSTETHKHIYHTQNNNDSDDNNNSEYSSISFPKNGLHIGHFRKDLSICCLQETQLTIKERFNRQL